MCGYDGEIKWVQLENTKIAMGGGILGRVCKQEPSQTETHTNVFHYIDNVHYFASDISSLQSNVYYRRSEITL